MEWRNEKVGVFTIGNFIFAPKVPRFSVAQYVESYGLDNKNLVIFVPSPNWDGTFYFLETLGFPFDLHSFKNSELQEKYGILVKVCGDEKELEGDLTKLGSAWREKVQPWRPKRGD